MDRARIKEWGKQQFKNQYGLMLGGYVLVAICLAFVSGITFGVGVLFLAPPILVGYAYFSLQVYRGKTADIGGLFEIGFSDYGRSLGGMLWMWLFTWLWSLLFIIPGIIKSYAYSMTPYLLAEHKNIEVTEVIKVSIKITKGYKADIFVFDLSYIGWFLLSGLTFGILQLLYVGPYYTTARAGVYEELKAAALRDGRITWADLGEPEPQEQEI